MFERLRAFDMRSIDWRALDLRAIATPLAIASPLALIVSAQEPVMGAVAVLFALHSWRERDWGWTRRSWFVPLLALWAYAFVRTLVLHPTATGALVALHWIHFAVYAAALATWILPEPRQRERLLWALIAAMTFFSVDCLLQFTVGRDIIGRPITYANRLTSVFSKPGVGAELGWLYLPAMAGLWARGYPWRAAAFGLISVAAVLLSGDRMALLLALSGFVLLGLFARRARKALLVALPAFAIVLAGLLYFSPFLYQRQVESTARVIDHLGESVYGIIFKTGLEIGRDHPALGVGVHNYQKVCREEKYGPLEVGPNDYKRCQGHPHNVFIQWFAETGLIGLALYLAFGFFALKRLIANAPANRDDLVYLALVVCFALRLWPLTASTSFYSSWSAEPLFLVLGWAMAYCEPPGAIESRRRNA